MPTQQLTPLTSVELIKRALRIIPTENSGDANVTKVDDGLFSDMVLAVGDRIERECGRTFGLITYTETRDGTGTQSLTLSQYPVQSVASVTLLYPAGTNGLPAQTTQLVSGTDYTFTRNAIKLYSRTFARGVANVQVVYVAGFSEIPRDVQQAATKWCAVRYRELERLGQRSRVIGGESVLFDLADLPPDVAGVIENYKARSAVPGFVSPLR